MKIDFSTLIGIFLSIFGVVVSIFSYIKTKKTKKIAVNSESTILISETLSKYENLKILYNDENIKSLTSTIVRIKNIGSDIVEPDDLVPSCPLTINTTKKFLLEDTSQYKISTSNTKNIVKLTKIDSMSLQISFDFLNPKDEIQITLLHTGDISVDGDLKSNPIKNYTKKKYENNDTKYNLEDEIASIFPPYKFMALFLSLMSLLLLCSSIITNELSIDRMILYFILMYNISTLALLQNKK